VRLKADTAGREVHLIKNNEKVLGEAPVPAKRAGRIFPDKFI